MCEFADTQLWTNAPGMMFALQRSWSNKAAGSGVDPCVGDGTVPYYQTIPDNPDLDTITLGADSTFGGGTASPHLTKIALNATGELVMHVFSDVETSGPYTVTVQDISGDTPPLLTITQPTGTFMPGDTVKVKVTVAKQDESVVSQTAEPFVVITAPMGGSAVGPSTYFYGLIGQ
jgi:hypothetical protein